VPLQTVAAAPSDTGSVQLKLLGGFSLSCEGVEADLPLTAQRLVAFLALQERPLLRLYVAGVLWPDGSEKRSYASLRSALWRLRRVGRDVVEAKTAHLRLAPGVSVDVDEAVRTARALLNGHPPQGPVDPDLLAAELLPDWYDDWAVEERERLRELSLRALETHVDRLTFDGSFDQAAEAGLAALRSDPLRESANRALIRVFLAEGNSAEALRRYHRFSNLLERELGIEPSMQMQELFVDLPYTS
jgi:DNA-binding SARP family transcriptional activator